MQKQAKLLSVLLIVTGTSLGVPGSAKKTAKDTVSDAEITGGGLSVLWNQPQDIPSENLFYGEGGQEHQPHGPYTFLDEDLNGTNPKFNVRDGDGVKWKVKLGDEARPETVASRFVWAVGYNTDWDYFLPAIQVRDLPAKLHRGQKMVGPGGVIQNVRLKREPDHEKKIGIWKWRKDPFAGTREWNGLRVLMALINNWDLKDENNAVRKRVMSGGGQERIYEVSDLGASFGRNELSLDRRVSKGELRFYSHSHFITKIGPEYVDFATPGRPDLSTFFNFHQFFGRLGLRWIRKNVPREDARWMGQLLGQLSLDQIRDAFRAGGYSPQDIDGFSMIVEARIAQLEKL